MWIGFPEIDINFSFVELNGLSEGLIFRLQISQYRCWWSKTNNPPYYRAFVCSRLTATAMVQNPWESHYWQCDLLQERGLDSTDRLGSFSKKKGDLSPRGTWLDCQQAVWGAFYSFLKERTDFEPDSLLQSQNGETGAFSLCILFVSLLLPSVWRWWWSIEKQWSLSVKISKWSSPVTRRLRTTLRRTGYGRFHHKNRGNQWSPQQHDRSTSLQLQLLLPASQYNRHQSQNANKFLGHKKKNTFLGQLKEKKFSRQWRMVRLYLNMDSGEPSANHVSCLSDWQWAKSEFMNSPFCGDLLYHIQHLIPESCGLQTKKHVYLSGQSKLKLPCFRTECDCWFRTAEMTVQKLNLWCRISFVVQFAFLPIPVRICSWGS